MTLTPAQTAWIAALRSGDYTQTQGQLEDPKTGGMCCLGVGCKLLLKEDAREVRYDDVFYYEERADAPRALQDVLNLRHQSGEFDLTKIPREVHSPWPVNQHGETGLALLNDRGFSFEQLADIIETYPEAVFK